MFYPQMTQNVFEDFFVVLKNDRIRLKKYLGTMFWTRSAVFLFATSSLFLVWLPTLLSKNLKILKE